MQSLTRHELINSSAVSEKGCVPSNISQSGRSSRSWQNTIRSNRSASEAISNHCAAKAASLHSGPSTTTQWVPLGGKVRLFMQFLYRCGGVTTPREVYGLLPTTNARDRIQGS